MSGDRGTDAVARARELVGLFVDPVEDFGTIAEVPASRVPEPCRTLLDHASHMTVAMERHHGGAVALRVVAEATAADGSYAREIVLVGPDRRVVQFGIVGIDLASIAPATADCIRAGREPLGRILLDAGVLCAVGDVALLAIAPGPHLAALVGDRPTFGRVARIVIDGRPAVRLLEVVADS